MASLQFLRSELRILAATRCRKRFQHLRNHHELYICRQTQDHYRERNKQCHQRNKEVQPDKLKPSLGEWIRYIAMTPRDIPSMRRPNQGEIDESGHLNRFRNQKKMKIGRFIKASGTGVAQSVLLVESTGIISEILPKRAVVKASSHYKHQR